MVFDTTIGAAPTPTVGPTITTTLLYNQGAVNLRPAPSEWFVLQDGGYPKWLAPVLGLFRGEVLPDPNRIQRSPSGRLAPFEAGAALAFTGPGWGTGRGVRGLPR